LLQKNKRGSWADFGVVFIVFMIFAVIMVGKDADDRLTGDIGEAQNQILNSYTVAEGSRFYIEKSAKYAALNTTYDGSDFNTEDFSNAFYAYLENLPSSNMGLEIISPTTGANRYNFRVEDNILLAELENPIVVQNLDKRFKIETMLSASFNLDLDELNPDEFKEAFEKINS